MACIASSGRRELAEATIVLFGGTLFVAGVACVTSARLDSEDHAGDGSADPMATARVNHHPFWGKFANPPKSEPL